MTTRIVIVGAMTLVASLAAQAPTCPNGANCDESRVPAYTLPDPLVAADGQRVADARTWTGKRRLELLKLFETHVYGRTPVGRPKQMTWEVVAEDRNARDGQAITKTVTLYFTGQKDAPAPARMNLYLTLPKRGRKVATFLVAGIGFNGQLPRFNPQVFDRGYGMVSADTMPYPRSNTCWLNRGS